MVVVAVVVVAGMVAVVVVFEREALVFVQRNCVRSVDLTIFDLW
jgi:hypothetical protein